MKKVLKYYDNAYVGIQRIVLTGIKNPLINIVGTTTLEDYEIVAYADDKKVTATIYPTADTNSFSIDVAIPGNAKVIRIYFLHNGSKNLIVRIKNSLFLRVISKGKSLVKKICCKFWFLIKLFGRFFRFAWREYHFLIPPTLWKKYFLMFLDRIKHDRVLFYNPFVTTDYNKWLKENNTEVLIEKQKYNPLISILIPVYNIKGKLLSDCLDSILNQTYSNFEICLVDDCLTLTETKETLEKYSSLDNRIRIKYRDKNGNISAASNEALKMAKGEFIGLVDDDDILDKNALYENIKVLNNNKKIDMIYSDEDKIDLKGNRCDPNFKPDYSPDTLMSMNYICHFTVIRKKLVDSVGGFALGLEGAQDYDLFLKVTEQTNNIYHISKILYHWRMIKGSTSLSLDNKKYASDKGKLALEEALKRRNLNGTVSKDEASSYYIIDYKVNSNPLVSIIIPTRDFAETLDCCLKSIYEKTTYKNFEIIIANNNSKEKATFDLFDKYKKEHSNFKVIDINIEFNYSNINNIAIKKSKGEYILLLNNDTEIITESWLTKMVGYASLSHVGAVGAKLLYTDMTVQHGGVILGLGGVASHAYIGASRDDTGMYGRLRVPYNYSAVTAACLMVSRKKYDEVNGLDENLKVAYNDIDFNIKLLQKGYYNVFLPNVEIIHFESKSRGLDTSTEKYKRFLIESRYMYDKWPKELDNDTMYNSNFSRSGWFMLDMKNGKENK